MKSLGFGVGFVSGALVALVLAAVVAKRLVDGLMAR